MLSCRLQLLRRVMLIIDCVIVIYITFLSFPFLEGNTCSSSGRNGPSSSSGSEEDDRGPSSSYSLVLHSKSTTASSSSSNPPKPLWRKREVVRQERTVHYTTVDEHGDQQVRFDQLIQTPPPL